MDIKPITLVGRTVRLVPLSEAHVPGLARVGLDDSIWRLMRYGEMRTEADIHRFVTRLLQKQAAGTDLPFAVVLIASGEPIGCTRYMDIDQDDRSVEIGGTWYGTAYQGSGVNTECKYLLLSYAFENLGCIRVHFKTDLRNVRSQRAIEKLGAVREGLVRNHVILPDGYIRSSVIYSILAEEWPAVKANLEQQIA
ncbi:MAG: GNAT family N-acetyltransferase [Anaerolineales bacterium]|nr:GNAT family N-acetyltransferase [Anaerolineales bacterium]